MINLPLFAISFPLFLHFNDQSSTINSSESSNSSSTNCTSDSGSSSDMESVEDLNGTFISAKSGDGFQVKRKASKEKLAVKDKKKVKT